MDVLLVAEPERSAYPSSRDTMRSYLEVPGTRKKTVGVPIARSDSARDPLRSDDAPGGQVRQGPLVKVPALSAGSKSKIRSR